MKGVIPLDRSRFLDSFHCPWKRLLKFHSFGTGIEKETLYAPLSTGLSIHSALEEVLKHFQTSSKPQLDRSDIEKLVDGPVVRYAEQIKKIAFEDSEVDPRQQTSIVVALAHAYTRIVLPWLSENFEIVDVEEGQAVQLPPNLLWRSRADFVTRSKQTKSLAIHDFKSAATFYDNQSEEWGDSLQQMLNAYVASMNYGERIDHYYIHILVKGTKKSPSYLTHPMYRPANPPLVQEDILPHYTPKTGYLKVFAPEIPLSIAEWVWKADPAYVAKAVPVVGPFTVDYNKVERFLKSLPRYEKEWQDKLGVVSDWENWKTDAFQNKLDELFPRTFNCYEYGGRRCQFYGICHHQPGWDDPLGSKLYRPRVPHHQIGEAGDA